MFDENFTFHTTSRTPSLDSTGNTSSTRQPSRSVSPCSPITAFPQPRFSVTDLAATFASSRLRTDAQICYDSCDAYANPDDDAGWEIPLPDDDLSSIMSRSRTVPSRSHSPSRRIQRQLNTRLLCSISHARDISSLLNRMVDDKEQCNILSQASLSSPVEVDEGYNSSDARPIIAESRRSSVAVSRTRMEFRRSSELKTTCARVAKPVQIRKRKDHKRIRSAESES
ncbi:Hypothetical predicted protein [Lecanosticta acicola]|uniref:Uncharacterized protein n=1 Tax=Lecanosticta acicola TaxID=111012 RepID=A0AAI8W0R0_9PEZI|nr:Hypothetical predicted protein [Lecanosticta acicola]